MREVRPWVLVHYDANGGYGHPDHIQAHRVAVAAAAAAADPETAPEAGPAFQVPHRYETAFGSGRWLELMRAMRERGLALPWSYDEVLDAAEPAERPGMVEPPVTTTVDVTPWVGAKRTAMACHRTQRQDFGWAIELPDDLAMDAFGSERFVLVEEDGSAPERGRSETSLF
jgi:N-acetyl-1-D-myo-inositol-2-amino-2-deoxy-alpha-D-glucopyranoside deacetylase